MWQEEKRNKEWNGGGGGGGGRGRRGVDTYPPRCWSASWRPWGGTWAAPCGWFLRSGRTSPAQPSAAAAWTRAPRSRAGCGASATYGNMRGQSSKCHIVTKVHGIAHQSIEATMEKCLRSLCILQLHGKPKRLISGWLRCFCQWRVIGGQSSTCHTVTMQY